MERTAPVPPIRGVANDLGVDFCLFVYQTAGWSPLDVPDPARGDAWLDPSEWLDWLRAVVAAEFARWVAAQSLDRLRGLAYPGRVSRLLETQQRMLRDYPSWWHGNADVRGRLEGMCEDFREAGARIPQLTDRELNDLSQLLGLPQSVSYADVRSILLASFPARRSIVVSTRALVLTMGPGDEPWGVAEIARLFEPGIQPDDEPPSISARLP